MIKLKWITVIFMAFSLMIIFFQSCKKDNETNISSYNDSKSHNMGQNCMSCHKKGGSGNGLFQVAGTVYDSTKTNIFPNATVKLFTGPNETGTVKYTIEVDANGNFYTTETIDFGSGLYASVQGNLTTQSMSSIVNSGQCNSCHGVSTGKIWTK